MRNFLLINVLLLFTISCNKNKAKPGNNIELYLLSSYQLIPGKCQVDTSNAILQNSPLIKNEDILQYKRTTYEYTLSNSAVGKVKQLIGRTPFAVTVDKKVIFYGFYMPWIMSSTCFNSITMSDGTGANTISMNLGYPGVLAGVDIDDQRNNSTLIATFINQAKLR